MDGDQTATATAPQEPPGESEEAPKAPQRRAPRTKREQVNGTAVRVTFEDFDEFMDALVEEAALVEDAIVRATLREAPPTKGYFERTLTLLAGYLVRGQVVELQAASASYWGEYGATPDDVAAAVAAQLETLRTTCEAGGLELRGGRFGAL